MSRVVRDNKFSQSRDSMLWVQQRIDGLTLANPCKRSHLSAACLHASIEHGIAIFVLVSDGLRGSALALVRLQLEAYIRGIWLAECAGDNEVNKAGRDDFPKIDRMISDLEKPGLLDNGLLSKIKGNAWKSLNSLTHTGYQQIGQRLGKDGVGSYFNNDQIQTALNWAESLTILSGIGIAGLAASEPTMLAFLERARDAAAS